MLELNDTNFQGALKEGKFLLMFYTDWCPLCPPIIEMLTELEQTEAGKFQFLKINYDASAQANEFYGIPGVPTVLAVQDDQVLHGWSGLVDKDAYRMIINEIFE